MKRGKKYLAALEKIEVGKETYALKKRFSKLKEIAFAKFDETVELTMWLGVDPRKADRARSRNDRSAARAWAERPKGRRYRAGRQDPRGRRGRCRYRGRRRSRRKDQRRLARV